MQHLILVRPLLLLCKRTFTTAKVGLLTGLLFLLAAAANPAGATGFYKDFVVVNGSYYYTNNNVGGLPAFQGTNLGTFNVRTDALRIGTEGNFFLDPSSDEVQSVAMYYRVYQQGNPNGAFTRLDMTFIQAGIDGDNNRKWNNITSKPNLLNGINPSSTGTYVLEVYFRGDGTQYNGPNNPRPSFEFYDSRFSNNYQATFQVVNTLTWNGNSDNNWFTASNWNPAAVPSGSDDVVIPNLGSSTRIPTIYGGIAAARNLTIVGTGSSSTSNPNQRAQLQLGAGNGGTTELWVYGDYKDAYGGLRQSAGIFVLKGTGSQTFDGTIFTDFRVDGDGDKTLSQGTNMLVNNSLVFNSNVRARIITSNSASTNPNQDGITLLGTATLSGETEASYILGVVRATRTVGLNDPTPQRFGNIGVDLTTTNDATGNTTVVRLTNIVYQGVSNSVSIRRSFQFTVENPNSMTANLVFHYLDGELNGIAEPNLRLFRTYTGAAPFEGIAGSVSNTADNTLTTTGIVGSLASATFTLGDVNRPLPVELVSFTATGTAQGAALKWLTASEVNNKGFGVERQVAGATTWQSVGYVNATNQANGSSYSFLDKTIPASTTQVYYRLRQEDFDGSLHYSPVATISRAAQGADLTLSPVPLQSGPLAVSFAEAGQAGTEILVLNMQGQRVAHYTTAPSTDGAVSLPLDNLAAGVYVLSVQVPGQATRHARFVKQ